MDRFKFAFSVTSDKVSLIYIPLWIDLNEAARAGRSRSRVNLHSTMDRFK